MTGYPPYEPRPVTQGMADNHKRNKHDLVKNFHPECNLCRLLAGVE